VTSLASQFSKTATKMPEQIAIVFGDQQIEYGRLLEAVRRLAAGLSSLGVQKGDRVAILLPNLPHFCISYYASLFLGAIAVPINIMSNESQLAYLLQQSNAKVLISWTGFLAQVLAAGKATPSCEQIILLGPKMPTSCVPLTRLIAQSAPLTEGPESMPEEAVICYTMAAADEELGALMSHSALLANATTCAEMFRIGAEDRVAGIMPLFHPLGQTLAMNATFLSGATLVLLPRFSAPAVVEAINQHRVTFMPAAPGMFRALIEGVPADISTPSLKLCLSYGGSMPEELLKTFETKFGAWILESYGLTEAGPLVSANRLNLDRKIGSVGLPLVGVDVQIRDELGVPLRPNKIGEIWINSPSTMIGYWSHPEPTAERLKNGWLFSGDMGYLDDEHYLFIQERKDDIIVKGGFHIYPFEVEAILKQHYEVAEVAVVAVPDAAQGSEVKAYVVRKPGGTCGSEELIEYCRNNLPYYKSPRYVEFCECLPKSATGRVLKYKLRKQAAVNYKGSRQPR